MIKDAFGMKLPLDQGQCVWVYGKAAQLVVYRIARNSSCYAITKAQREFNPEKSFDSLRLKELFASYFKPVGHSGSWWFEEDIFPPTKEISKAEDEHRVIALLFMAEICKDMEEVK